MPVISTNNAANSALNYLNQNSSQETNLLAKLASGSRIVMASDDAAGLAIGTQLNANIAVYQQDSVNVQQGSSILQSTDGALGQISNILQRMLSLATQAASGQVSDAQRSNDIQTEYSQLINEIDSISSSTRYGDQQLLQGTFLSSVNFLVGTQATDTINVSVGTVASTSIGGQSVSGTSVTTANAASTAIGTLNSAIIEITKERATVGAYESQFNFSGQDISTNVQNMSAASSVIMDADVAAVKSTLSATDVKTQAAVAALTQASQLPQELLKLLQA